MTRPLSQAYPYGIPILSTTYTDGTVPSQASLATVMQTLSDGFSDMLGDFTYTVVAAFSNSWANYGSGFAPARYRRIGQQIFLDGLIAGGTLAQPVFTLPAGYRPPSTYLEKVWSNTGTASVQVTSAGVVSVPSYGTGGSNGFVSLAGVSFMVD